MIDSIACGHLSLSDVGSNVTLAGWVDALRDHGEVLFVHLRDRSGIVQVVFSPQGTSQAVCDQAATLRGEYCVLVTGRVVRRAQGTENPGIATGAVEVAAGSIRINDRSLQQRIFQALGLTDGEVTEKFGFFLKALDFGAPPHGGIALGIDRVVAMILGTASIREVIAFPKNRSAFCPLTRAPSAVDPAQLAELGLLDLGGPRPLPAANDQQDVIDRLVWVSRIGINDQERPAIAAAVGQARACAERVIRHGGADEPIYSVAAVTNRTREGTLAHVHQLAQTGELFASAPARKGGYFQVAAVAASSTPRWRSRT